MLMCMKQSEWSEPCNVLLFGLIGRSQIIVPVQPLYYGPTDTESAMHQVKLP